jgi:hypothetical protein
VTKLNAKWFEGTVSVMNFVAEEFDINTSANVLQLTSTINGIQRIEVSVGGIVLQETNAWTRDTVNKRILLTSFTPNNSWAEVKIYA